MDCKQLYHMDTDTLISLYPKGMILEVKKSYVTTYRMEKTKFAILLLLTISHPHVVTYQEVSEVLETVDIKIVDINKLSKKVKSLQKELKSYGIKNLIITIKGVGYAISNKWIEPIGIPTRKKNNAFMKYIRKLCGIATITKHR